MTISNPIEITLLAWVDGVNERQAIYRNGLYYSDGYIHRKSNIYCGAEQLVICSRETLCLLRYAEVHDKFIDRFPTRLAELEGRITYVK